VDANLRNRFFGESPLFWATAAANTAVLEALVEAGVDVNASDAEGRLLLHLLAAQGKPEQVMILLAGGADGTLRSIGGHVAFDLAKHNPSVKEDGGILGVKCGPVSIDPVLTI